MAVRAALRIAVLAFVALTWLAPAIQAAAPENKYAVAVIVGNKAYAGRVPDVDFAHNDAEAMKRFVIDVLGYRDGNIIDLRDATRARLDAVFGTDKTHKGQLFDWVRPDKSDVLVFYSGHGVPGLRDQRGYLLPVDGDPNRAEITGYPIEVLYQNLSQIPARSVTVFLDTCFSGDTPKGMLVRATSGLSVIPKVPRASSALTILTAARGDQVASWDEEAKHGLFTKHLLEALHGAADKDDYGDGDGEVTVAEIQRYLDEEMTYQARRRFGREQVATVLGDETTVLATWTPGEAPLASKPSAASAMAVDEMNLEMVAVKNSNIRAGPSTSFDRVTTLSRGARITVTGKVKDANWYRVALAGGEEGFVFARLLEEALVGSEPAPLPSPAGGDPSRVILDSGLTLADWALLAEDRLQRGEYVSLVVEADQHQRRHGAFPEVQKILYAALLSDVRTREGLDKVERAASYRKRFGAVPGLEEELEAATDSVLADLKVFDAASARAALTSASKLEVLVGPSHPVLALQARAHHLIWDFDAATSYYQRWLRVASRDNPQRKQMAVDLLKARNRQVFEPQASLIYDF